MLKGLVSDNDVRGQFDALVRVCTSPAWQDIWQGLGLRVYTLERLGLTADAADAEIWRVCQQEGLVLVTGNRNADAPDSLENTIRAQNRPESLPVLTLADPFAVEHDRGYAERVAVRMMEVLFDIDNCRGTGRLYLP
jgi:predicted nuclease of predicted toxin-antitoxin system